MRNWLTFFMTLMVGSSLSYVEAFSNTQVNFEAGYRRDNIRWSTKVPGDDPRVETSTRFEDLDIFQIALNAKTTCGLVYLRANADWGWIVNGDFRETNSVRQNVAFATSSSTVATSSSFFGNSSEGVSIQQDAHTSNVIDEKFVVDFDVALGYPFYLCNCTLTLSPVVGYAFSEQNIQLEGSSAIDFTFNSAATDFSDMVVPTFDDRCCNETFISRWYGPFVGVDFNWVVCDNWDLYAMVEYHWAHFKGKRHARSGFDFFDGSRRATNADGWRVKVGANYDFCNCWTFGFSASFIDLVASRHHHFNRDEIFDSSFFSSSGDDRYESHNKWRSYSFNLTLGRAF